MRFLRSIRATIVQIQQVAEPQHASNEAGVRVVGPHARLAKRQVHGFLEGATVVGANGSEDAKEAIGDERCAWAQEADRLDGIEHDSLCLLRVFLSSQVGEYQLQGPPHVERPGLSAHVELRRIK